MFKSAWNKIKSIISPKKPLEPASMEFKMAKKEEVEVKQESNLHHPRPDLPKTIADIIKQETPKSEQKVEVKADAPKPKKPRKPRVKPVDPSPEVLAIYAEPKKDLSGLDNRLDGFVSKPKKPRKPKAPKTPK